MVEDKKIKITRKNLRQLIRDIIDEEMSERAEEEDIDIDEMNVSHDKEGLFTTPGSDNEACISSYFVDGTRASKKGSLRDKHRAGRGPTKSGHGDVRCYDDKNI